MFFLKSGKERNVPNGKGRGAQPWENVEEVVHLYLEGGGGGVTYLGGGGGGGTSIFYIWEVVEEVVHLYL